MKRASFQADMLTGKMKSVAHLPNEAHKIVPELNDLGSIIQIEKVGDRWQIVNVTGAQPEYLGSFADSSGAVEFVRVLDLLLIRELVFLRDKVAAMVAEVVTGLVECQCEKPETD